VQVAYLTHGKTLIEFIASKITARNAQPASKAAAAGGISVVK
jgi:hypothetical protein